MCKNYTDEQIIEQLYKIDLIKKLVDIETINQFIIQPRVEEKQKILLDELVNTIKEENKKELVNVKIEIVRYSKPKRPQWKTQTEPTSSLQPIYEYRTILNINNTQDLKKIGNNP